MPVVVVMVDVTSKNTREHIHPQIMASLQQYSHIPSVLVLNKVSQWYMYNMHERESTLGGREGGREGEKGRGERHPETIFMATLHFPGRERKRERRERERQRLYIFT